MSAKVHFCTFGSLPDYGPALARIGKQAQDSKYFESVNCFTQDNTPGLAAHADFIAKSPKGYGYWIWKPLIILETMRRSQENDVIVYADAGCYINSTPEAKRKFEVYLSLIKTNAPHRISFQLTYPEESYTKSDVLNYFKALGTVHATSRHMAGTYMILMNTPDNRAIMEELHQILASDDHHLHDDSPSRIPNAQSFIEHRHDQSVISVLMKMRGTILVEDVYPPKDTDPIAPMRSRRA